MAAHDGDVCRSTKRMTAGVTKVFQTRVVIVRHIALGSYVELLGVDLVRPLSLLSSQLIVYS
jgi:hypothetical protein